MRPTCRHLGEPTGETLDCGTCRGRVSLKVFTCAVFGQCTASDASAGIHHCGNCQEWQPREGVLELIEAAESAKRNIARQTVRQPERNIARSFFRLAPTWTYNAGDPIDAFVPTAGLLPGSTLRLPKKRLRMRDGRLLACRADADTLVIPSCFPSSSSSSPGVIACGDCPTTPDCWDVKITLASTPMPGFECACERFNQTIRVTRSQTNQCEWTGDLYSPRLWQQTNASIFHGLGGWGVAVSWINNDPANHGQLGLLQASAAIDTCDQPYTFTSPFFTSVYGCNTYDGSNALAEVTVTPVECYPEFPCSNICTMAVKICNITTPPDCSGDCGEASGTWVLTPAPPDGKSCRWQTTWSNPCTTSGSTINAPFGNLSATYTPSTQTLTVLLREGVECVHVGPSYSVSGITLAPGTITLYRDPIGSSLCVFPDSITVEMSDDCMVNPIPTWTTLTYSSGEYGDGWYSSVDPGCSGGDSVQWAVICDGGDWSLKLTCDGSLAEDISLRQLSSSPLQLQGNIIGNSPCCPYVSGMISAFITASGTPTVSTNCGIIPDTMYLNAAGCCGQLNFLADCPESSSSSSASPPPSSSSSSASPVVTAGRYYKLDDGSGTTAIDSGTAGIDGVLTGTQGWSADVPAAITFPDTGSFDFDGASYFAVGNLEESLFSCCYWLKRSAYDLGTFYVIQPNTSAIVLGSYWWQGFMPGSASFPFLRITHRIQQPGGGSWTLQNDDTIVAGQWHHVGFTYDGNDLNLYVDGSLVDTDSTGSPVTFAYGNAYYLGGFANSFDGKIDDFRYYSRALDAGEVATLAGGGEI